MKYIFRFFIFLLAILLNTKCFALEFISHIPPTPKEALIVIHGYGQEGKSMQWLSDNFKDEFPNMAFYYPTSPISAPIGGYQWFTIRTLGEPMMQKEIYDIMMSSAQQNIDKLHNLIEHIHNTHQIDYKNIHISGFSQGGFMAILSSLTTPLNIGKVISFSGVPIIFTEDFTKNNIKSSPDILIIQGNNDKIIPHNSYDLTFKTLESQNITPQLEIIHNMPHIIDDKAIKKATEFLKTK